MKVVLTKKAEYEFNEEKFTKLEANVFNMLIGDDCVSEVYEKLPELVVFENRADYMLCRSEYNFEPEKPVFVNGKGQIFRFIRKTGVVSDGTTDSE